LFHHRLNWSQAWSIGVEETNRRLGGLPSTLIGSVEKVLQTAGNVTTAVAESVGSNAAAVVVPVVACVVCLAVLSALNKSGFLTCQTAATAATAIAGNQSPEEDGPGLAILERALRRRELARFARAGSQVSTEEYELDYMSMV
jgi:hypothetical protein